MGWFNTGSEAIDHAWDDVPMNEGKDDRFFLPYPGAKKKKGGVYTEDECKARLLWLDNDPCSFWEHQFRIGDNFRVREPCHKRNKQLASESGGECPPCDKDEKYPYFVGLYTVINMTPFFGKHGVEYNFSRKMFPAKLGGKEKPGVLKKIDKLRERHGRLRGLVFEVERNGKKTETCGTEFELIEKIDQGEIEAYCMEQMNEYLKRRNAKLADDKKVTLEKLLEWNPWETYNWDEVIKRRSIQELRTMFGKGGGFKPSDFSDDSSGGSADDGVDDDVPY